MAEVRVQEGEPLENALAGAQDLLTMNSTVQTGQASISMIQRRLRIGYNRSARMVEQMEREGIVTPPDGARPRELRVRPGLSEE